MKIITLNVNGLRAACAKGLLPWLARQRADVVCLQEIKARPEQLPPAAQAPAGYTAYFNPAEKSGYSGVAMYCRRTPLRITRTLGWDEADSEGRYLQADFDSLSVASIYLPSGTSGPHRQAVKFRFLDRLLPVLKRMRAERRRYILCGDWNIAHTERDLRNWRANRKNSGFLPEERAWLDQVFGTVGMVDAFRQVNQREDQYTWWSSRGRAFENNVGWRIDYQIVSPALAGTVRSARICRKPRFSDHAPLIMEYDAD
jgi:exodeoxyribonuclease-3